MSLIICSNCAVEGHSHKVCRDPVSSFGIICFRKEESGVKYLLIQRKHSISYIDFVRGKYSFENIGFLNMLFRNMTLEEKLRLKNEYFDFVWKDLWINNTDNRSYRNEYRYASKKFETIKEGYRCDSRFYSIDTFINSSRINGSLEWGFPKGRRYREEKDIVCAKREFEEETNYSGECVEFLKNEYFPLTEEFIGTNNVAYRYVYYVCEYKGDLPAKINRNNSNQVSEIGNIGWFDYNEAHALLNISSPRRANLFCKIQKLIKNE